jgi:hypothetical protein
VIYEVPRRAISTIYAIFPSASRKILGQYFIKDHSQQLHPTLSLTSILPSDATSMYTMQFEKRRKSFCPHYTCTHANGYE